MKNDPLPRSVRAAIEPLERRVLFAVQVNTNVFDAVTPSGSYPIPGAFAGQAETSNVTFSMPGSSNNQVEVAYNDGSMLQYGQVNGAPMHQTGWAYSTDGGQSFAQPSTDPANPALLPTVSDGTETTGDQANHALGWDNANATLYMANTSYPNESDINVYASTDGGQTFSSVADATFGAPTSTNLPHRIVYDKPWLAVDNTPGTNFGTVYLAYVQIYKDATNPSQIVVADLQPGKSWPAFSSQFTLNTEGIINVQSPQVLVEPNHYVDIVFIGQDANTGAYGIYFDRSANPTLSYGWTAAPTLLTTFQNVNGLGQFDDLYALHGGLTSPTIARIPIFPSSAVGINSSNGKTYLYTVWMDANQTDAIDVPFGIYGLEYNLSDGTPIGNSSDHGPIAQISGVEHEWMPSLALSLDGRYAFVGFYGGNGVYYPTTDTADEQYNTFYVTGATNADGVNWGSPKQITNVDGTGKPTGGYFDQPNGAQSSAQEWNPDYDSASADWQNFHYSFMQTSNEQVTDGSGNQVNLKDQEDVYMANIPIPYVDILKGGTPPVAPYNVTFTPNGTDGGTVDWNTAPYQKLYAFAHIEYSTDSQGWIELTDPNNAPSATAGSYQVTIPNYSSGTTYYFRIRIQNVPNPQLQLTSDSTSAYSNPVQSWTGGVPTLDNALYSLWGYVNGLPQYRVTVAWPVGVYDPSEMVQMQYYDGNNWTTQFPNADGSVTTLGGGSGDTGWAETFVITDATNDPPAFNFSIFFQNASGGRSAYSNVLTAIDTNNIDVPAAPSIDQPTSSDPSNPTNESGDVWVSWNGALYGESDVMDVVLTPVNDSGGGPSVQTYAAYGDADVDGLDSGVEYEIQIRVEKTVEYEGETLTLTSDFSSPVYVIGI